MAKYPKKAKGIAEKTDRDWEIESAADTLMRAEEIKVNRALYVAAVKELEKRQKAIAKAAKQLKV